MSKVGNCEGFDAGVWGSNSREVSSIHIRFSIPLACDCESWLVIVERFGAEQHIGRGFEQAGEINALSETIEHKTRSLPAASSELYVGTIRGREI